MMGLSASVGGSGASFQETKAQKETHVKIEKEIGKAKIAALRTVKILLLGGPESGKTTIFKQMRILHQNGFSKIDLINYRYLVHSNVFIAVGQLLNGLKTFRMVPDKEIKEDIEAFHSYCAQTKMESDLDLNQEIAQKIRRIWLSDCVQSVFIKRYSIELLQCAERYLNSIERISDPNYLPDEQDILLCRKRTVGVHEISFDYRDLTFK